MDTETREILEYLSQSSCSRLHAKTAVRNLACYIDQRKSMPIEDTNLYKFILRRLEDEDNPKRFNDVIDFLELVKMKENFDLVREFSNIGVISNETEFLYNSILELYRKVEEAKLERKDENVDLFEFYLHMYNERKEEAIKLASCMKIFEFIVFSVHQAKTSLTQEQMNEMVA
jgi:hypothetical protein